MCPAALFSSLPTNAHHLFDKMPHPRNRPLSPRKLKLSSSTRPLSQELLFISEPVPPWPVHPPVLSKNPFPAELPVSGIGSGVPLSLKIVQLRKKNKNLVRMERGECDRGAVGNAVWSLASIMGEFQRTMQGCDCTENDASDSIVWLFRKVFYMSPEVVVGILGVMDRFLAVSVLPVLRNAVGNVFEPEVVGSAYFVPRCWSDIGVCDDDEESRMTPEILDYKKRRVAYEQLIISGTTNSMILLNYAQLLYQYDNDVDRAHDYFKLAVMAEPADAEARSRYALFLWHGLGDLEASEEMFLEAIETEPENHYYRSSYACFLWKTGGTETCYPLPVDDDGNNAI